MGTIHLIFGPQGAGKSTHARALAESVSGVRLSIDEWMGELYGPEAPKPLRLDWVMERVKRCEGRIWAVASNVARNGGDVVLDLGFTKAASRAAFQSLAAAEGLQVQMHYVTAPHDLRRRRVMERNQAKGTTFSFEVTPMMFDFMEREFEPATQTELENCSLLNSARTGV